MTTVRDVIAEERFGLRLRACEAALDQPVSWASVTEQVDPTPFMERDELVLTTGVRLRSTKDQAHFVKCAASVGAAAIGFGVGLGHDKIPRSLVSAAEEHHVPLIEVPYETPFIAITRWVSDRDVDAHTRKLSRLLSVHDRLAEHLLTGGGLPAFCEELRHQLGGNVAVIDQQANVLASAPIRVAWPAPALVRRLHKMHQPATVDIFEGAHQEAYVLPVGTHGRQVAVLATQGSRRNEELLRFAVSLVGLEMQRRQAVQHGRREQIGQIMEDVVRSALTHTEATRRLEAFGLDFTGGHRVLLGIVEADPDALRTLPWPLLGPDIDPEGRVVTAQVDRYLALIFGSEEVTRDSAPTVLHALRTLGRNAAVGIGGYYSGVDGLRWSFLEARDALSRGSGIHQGAPLSLERLLTANPELPMRELGEATLGPLLEQDPPDHPLMTTLTTFLDTGGSVNETAERLFVHRNTVRYRLDQIESLTGRSLSQTRDRVHLWLALHAIGYVSD
ncbi:PucR family transcriptional regulator ligand-binding domain-containing protein [Nocardioidaceae bacterium SCSIO 66511]|nr:PucR family transcriptional regulator ligand-binding domain-containing protein [Nocardioidaceae bacterium SCSIO 66511]